MRCTHTQGSACLPAGRPPPPRAGTGVRSSRRRSPEPESQRASAAPGQPPDAARSAVPTRLSVPAEDGAPNQPDDAPASSEDGPTAAAPINRRGSRKIGPPRTHPNGPPRTQGVRAIVRVVREWVGGMGGAAAPGAGAPKAVGAGPRLPDLPPNFR